MLLPHIFFHCKFNSIWHHSVFVCKRNNGGRRKQKTNKRGIFILQRKKRVSTNWPRSGRWWTGVHFNYLVFIVFRLQCLLVRIDFGDTSTTLNVVHSSKSLPSHIILFLSWAHLHPPLSRCSFVSCYPSALDTLYRFGQLLVQIHCVLCSVFCFLTLLNR